MPTLSKFLSGMFYKGGILTAGVACILLNKNDYLPRSTFPFSLCLVATGILGVALSCRNFIEEEDPDHDARMEEFYRLRPQLEEHIREHVILNLEYERMKRHWREVDEMERASQEYERIISAYEQRMAEAESEEVELRNLTLNKDDGSEVKRRHSLQLKELAKLSKFYCVF